MNEVQGLAMRQRLHRPAPALLMSLNTDMVVTTRPRAIGAFCQARAGGTAKVRGRRSSRIFPCAHSSVSLIWSKWYIDWAWTAASSWRSRKLSPCASTHRAIRSPGRIRPRRICVTAVFRALPSWFRKSTDAWRSSARAWPWKPGPRLGRPRFRS